MEVRPRLLPYTGLLEARALEAIDMIVIHCTELPDLAVAREFAERIHYPQSGTGNSGHYYVDRDGAIELWVPENRVAHHARDFNRRSLGIELVNSGRYPDWFHSQGQSMREPYPPAQVEALTSLIADITGRHRGVRSLAGHEDLDQTTVPASDDGKLRVRRKRDPGELFPWEEILADCPLERYRPQS